MGNASSSERRLPFDVPEELLNSLGEGITLTDRDGKIVFSNRAADRMLGLSATDSAPEGWSEYFGVFLPDGETPFPTAEYPIVRALSGESSDDVEMLVRNPNVPDGVLLSVTGRPLVNGDGEIVGASAVFTDITHLREAQRELRDANERLHETLREKEELSAFIVHDLKGPVSAILLLSELLVSSEAMNDEELEDLATIAASARGLHRMILDLLDVGVAEQGGMALEIEPVPVHEVLEEVAQEMKHRAEASGQCVKLLSPDDALVVRGDRSYLSRVVYNLADNCVKYASQGSLTLEALHGANGTALIRVSDNGPGVPPHLRERIFDKFSRVERDERRRHRDSRGLGLSFCRVAVEAHGGRVWVEDNEPTGARFCVELPIAS